MRRDKRALRKLLAFRRVAVHVYNDSDQGRAALAVQDARVFLAEIGPAMARFRATDR